MMRDVSTIQREGEAPAEPRVFCDLRLGRSLALPMEFRP
jgi:hypothetical protein